MSEHLFDEIKNLSLSVAEGIDRENAQKQAPILIEFLELLREPTGEEESFDQVTLAQDSEDFGPEDFDPEDYFEEKEDLGWIEGTLHR